MPSGADPDQSAQAGVDPRAARRTIVQRGRAKAYRPMPQADRRAALAAGLAAYERRDFFLAHEILEPAWMGASDHAERDLYQGLIKLSAAFVHGARHNPAGIARNLAGARELLAGAIEAGRAVGLDVAAILSDVDDRFEILRQAATDRVEPVPIARLGPEGA